MTERYCQYPGCGTPLRGQQQLWCSERCMRAAERSRRREKFECPSCGRPKMPKSGLCWKCHWASYPRHPVLPRGEWREGYKDRVPAMAEEGLTAYQIAEREGVSKNQVCGYCYRRGIVLGERLYEGPTSMDRLNELEAKMRRVRDETERRPEHFITERKQRTPEELAYTVRPLWREYVQ